MTRARQKHCKYYRVTRAAIVGALFLSGLAATSRAQQMLAGPNPADDPNFPGAEGNASIPGLTGTIYWKRNATGVQDWKQAGNPDFAANIPRLVMLPKFPDGPPGTGDYLGFVDGVGTLLERYDRTVYVYNATTHTLVRTYDRLDDIPPDVLASLKNRKYIYTSSKDRLNTLSAETTSSSVSPAHFVKNGPELDSNFPDTTVGLQDSYPMTWQSGTITIRSPQSSAGPAMYLGFNARGSWIASGRGKLFLWNISNKSLVEMASTWWDVPMDLRNPSALLQAIIYYREHAYSTAAFRGKTPDPNFPPTLQEFSRLYLYVTWQYQDMEDLTRPPLIGMEAGMPETYLGFDERGAWFLSQHGQVFVWSFKTWTATRIASRLSNVPKEALMRLRNADLTVLEAIKEAKVPATNAAAPTASNSEVDSDGTVSGTGATVQDGVLAFNKANGSKVSYKVKRPKAVRVNPEAGITGMWMAFIPQPCCDRVILFNVQADNSVTGREMTIGNAERLLREGKQ